MKPTNLNPDVELIIRFQKSPIFFIEKMWGLVPERDNSKFIKGKHISWQQHDILLATEAAIRGEKPKKISVRSGHGIGKSSTFSWLILWYLFTHKDAQISCTAPTSQQMYDVLWKEVKKWLDMMPGGIKELYDWQASYVRIKEKPEIWFARAATARKEAPEAFAGIHGENVMLAGDEASGIPEEIFESGRGALTNENAFVFLFGNPLRLIGYFYDTHHGNKQRWQTLGFSSLDSPLVDKNSGLIQEIRDKYSEDSDEWKTRVLGEFPRADAIDEKGYVPLLLEGDVRYVRQPHFVGDVFLGIDCAGEGKDKTVWVGRDLHKAVILGDERISTSRSIAAKSLTFMDLYGVRQNRVVIDNFGEGANVAHEIEIARQKKTYNQPIIESDYVHGVNLGDHGEDETFLNKRAECAFLLRKWLRQGGELLVDERWKEIFLIRYRVVERSGKMQIMSKEEMRKMGMPSPDYFDALLLTFYFGLGEETTGLSSSLPDWGEPIIEQGLSSHFPTI